MTAAEEAELYTEKVAVQLKDEEYLARHPELAGMLREFLASLMDDKPDNVLAYAVRYFTGGGGGARAGAPGDGR